MDSCQLGKCALADALFFRNVMLQKAYDPEQGLPDADSQEVKNTGNSESFALSLSLALSLSPVILVLLSAPRVGM